MKTPLVISVLIFMGVLLGFCNEVAVPDAKLLGKPLISLDKSFFVGGTNSAFPDHIEFEMRGNNIASIVAVYPQTTSCIDIKNAISNQLGSPTKEFKKESGSKMYEWRNETVAALFSEKNEQNQRPMIIVSYIKK